MQISDKSILDMIVNESANDLREKLSISSINASIDCTDILILKFISRGESRSKVATHLHKTLRTIENRLNKLRVLFNCHNTTHLIATLALLPAENLYHQMYGKKLSKAA